MLLDFCSIDKIKIMLKLSQPDIENFNKINSMQVNINEYNSNSLKSCRLNWQIAYLDKNKTNSFYIGFSPNWITNPNESKYYVVIEYNPNKVKPEEQIKGFKILLRQAKRVKIMYIDYAFDIFDNEMEDFIFLVRHGNEYTADIGHGGKVETKYFGVFGENGTVRIYDKSKEQGIKDYKWIRYEIRIKDINFGDDADRVVLTKGLKANAHVERVFELNAQDHRFDSYLQWAAIEFENGLIDLLQVLFVVANDHGFFAGVFVRA
jgi:hypothetical protein